MHGRGIPMTACFDLRKNLDLTQFGKYRETACFNCSAVMLLAPPVHPSCLRVLSSWLCSCEQGLEQSPYKADINLVTGIQREGLCLPDFSISRFLLELKEKTVQQSIYLFSNSLHSFPFPFKFQKESLLGF